MHSLEPECLELRAAGVIDEPAGVHAAALERGAVFSVFEELRFVLYAAVAAVTGAWVWSSRRTWTASAP